MAIKPPSRRPSLADSPIAAALETSPTPNNTTVPNNEATEDYAEDLSFKVSHSFARRFRAEAALRGMRQKALLIAMAELYYRTNGGSMTEISEAILPQRR